MEFDKFGFFGVRVRVEIGSYRAECPDVHEGVVVYAGDRYFVLQTDKGYKETVSKIDLRTRDARITWCEDVGAFNEWLGVKLVEKMRERVEAIQKKIDKKKEEENEMARGQKVDTPEMEEIRKDLEARGFGKKLSPRIILNCPKEKVQEVVGSGGRDRDAAEVLGVSSSTMSHLRKYYGLKNSKDIRAVLERVGMDRKLPESVKDDAEVKVEKPEDMVAEEIMSETLEDCAIFKNVRIADDEEGDPEWLEDIIRENEMAEIEETEEPPLLFVKDKASVVVPLIRGIADYLGRLEDQEVEVVVRVWKV